MRLSLAALAACVPAVCAFKDTSPFIFVSTSDYPSSMKDTPRVQVQSSRQVLDATMEFLSSCPTDVYYIVHQPSILPTDVFSVSAFPYLEDAVSSSSSKTRYMVSEARGLGSDVKQELVAYLEEKCGETQLIDLNAPVQTNEALESQISRIRKAGKKAIVFRTTEELTGPSKSPQRLARLNKIDRSHNFELSTIAKESSHTIIWTTTAPPADSSDYEAYEPEFQSPVHTEMKRDLGIWGGGAKIASNNSDPRPLFEKYQFLTPGIFMGLLTGFILIAILSVGLKAISSLQVSYAAFDKDMGPAAQKKQS